MGEYIRKTLQICKVSNGYFDGISFLAITFLLSILGKELMISFVCSHAQCMLIIKEWASSSIRNTDMTKVSPLRGWQNFFVYMKRNNLSCVRCWWFRLSAIFDLHSHCRNMQCNTNTPQCSALQYIATSTLAP